MLYSRERDSEPIEISGAKYDGKAKRCQESPNDPQGSRGARRRKNTSIRYLIVFDVIEKAMRHFFLRAGTGKAVGRSQRQVDEDYKQAAALAALVAPYRHARLSAMKLAGDPT